MTTKRPLATLRGRLGIPDDAGPWDVLRAGARRAAPAGARAEIAALRRRIDRRSPGPVVCGPFLGEPGYETLYWIPFLKTVAGPLLDAGRDVVVMSRGGAEPLYRELVDRGARYVDVLDVLAPEEFMRRETERLRDPFQRNQKRPSAYETRLLGEAELSAAEPLLPSHMFPLLNAYPYASVCDWSTWPVTRPADDGADRTLLKFWFGGQLPGTPENVERLERLIERIAAEGPVAAVSNPHSLEPNRATDDAFDALVERLGVPTLTTTSPRTNLGEQVEMLAGSARLACTYGGLAYLSLYTDRPAVTYFTEPKIVFSPHFTNFAHALDARNAKGAAGSLSVSVVDLGRT